MWLFSWVQLVTIGCGIVRTKLVALWLGSMGVGLFGLFNTAIDAITTLTQLGIRQSPVRNIASAGEDGTLAVWWPPCEGGHGYSVSPAHSSRSSSPRC
jgi:O-antigen/teichoic acid export membrane protein